MGTMAWIILGLQQGGKWRMILRDGQRAQVAEESQQMLFSGVETKKLLPHLNKMMKLYRFTSQKNVKFENFLLIYVNVRHAHKC